MQFEKHGISFLDIPGFSFLSFDGDHDGEDIKALFKTRIAEADLLLMPEERQDVVQAAQGLFDDCIMLVGMLDRAVEQQRIKKKTPFVLICIVRVMIVFLYGWAKFGYGH